MDQHTDKLPWTKQKSNSTQIKNLASEKELDLPSLINFWDSIWRINQQKKQVRKNKLYKYWRSQGALKKCRDFPQPLSYCQSSFHNLSTTVEFISIASQPLSNFFPQTLYGVNWWLLQHYIEKKCPHWLDHSTFF